MTTETTTAAPLFYVTECYKGLPDHPIREHAIRAPDAFAALCMLAPDGTPEDDRIVYSAVPYTPEISDRINARIKKHRPLVPEDLTPPTGHLELLSGRERVDYYHIGCDMVRTLYRNGNTITSLQSTLDQLMKCYLPPGHAEGPDVYPEEVAAHNRYSAKQAQVFIGACEETRRILAE